MPNPKKYDRDASTLTVGHLRRLVEELAVPGVESVAASKHDLVRALQRHFVRETWGDAVPQKVRDALVYRPMLMSFMRRNCGHTTEPWASSDWVFEEKCDGYRLLVGRAEGGDSIYAFSRYLSDSDFIPIEHPVSHKRISGSRFLVDVELIEAENGCLADELGAMGYPLSGEHLPIDVAMTLPDNEQVALLSRSGLVEYVVLDVLEAPFGKVSDRPLCDRREAIPVVLDAMVAAGIPCRAVRTAASTLVEDKLRFYREAEERGWEGVVAKDLRSRYAPGWRSDRWVKYKFLPTDDADTIDAFIGEYIDSIFDEARLMIYRPWGGDPVELAVARVPGGEGVVPVGSVVEVRRDGKGGIEVFRLKPGRQPEDCVVLPSIGSRDEFRDRGV